MDFGLSHPKEADFKLGVSHSSVLKMLFEKGKFIWRSAVRRFLFIVFELIHDIVIIGAGMIHLRITLR